jgi:hypothetical protein
VVGRLRQISSVADIERGVMVLTPTAEPSAPCSAPHRGAAPLETASIEAVSQDDAAARWMPSRNAPAKATHVSDL